LWRIRQGELPKEGGKGGGEMRIYVFEKRKGRKPRGTSGLNHPPYPFVSSSFIRLSVCEGRRGDKRLYARSRHREKGWREGGRDAAQREGEKRGC
jgi:hypothetical protein